MTDRSATRLPAVVAAAAALVAVAVAASGCSADEQSTDELPIRLKRVTDAAQYIGPAQERLLSPQQRTRLLLAYDTLLAECVEKQGESLSITDAQRPQWLRELVTPMFAALPLGPVNARRVAQYGFHDPEATIGPESVDFQGPRTPKRVIAACEGPTTEKLGGTPPEGVSNMVFAAGRAAGNDSRLAVAQESWASCMAAQGYDYDLPTQAQREFTTSSEITDREVEVATASVECQAKARNIDTYVALRVAYEERLIESNFDLFADFDAWKGRALNVAAEVTAERPPPPNRTVLPPPSLGMGISDVG